jgi:predicted 3-demethylubiquinone-9 3-methyltransferase (glyoxalase superfamily)
VSWQIVPTVLERMLQGTDAKRVETVMHALLQMRKIDIRVLKEAYAE